MRKLTLQIDSLQVESFDTGGDGGRGTVRGNDTAPTEFCTGYPDCISKPRCQTPKDTCYQSCGCTNGRMLSRVGVNVSGSAPQIRKCSSDQNSSPVDAFHAQLPVWEIR